MKSNLIRAALNNNGITKGNVKIHIRNQLTTVYVDGNYYGIYDTQRRTFVD